MNRDPLPYIVQCHFCKQGLLRFMRCQHCGDVAAICDECELVWQYVATVSEDPSTPSSATFPACPACRDPDPGWQMLGDHEVRRAGLGAYVAGRSC